MHVHKYGQISCCTKLHRCSLLRRSPSPCALSPYLPAYLCRSAGSKSPLVWTKMSEWRTINSQLTVPHTQHCMQVCTMTPHKHMLPLHESCCGAPSHPSDTPAWPHNLL